MKTSSFCCVVLANISFVVFHSFHTKGYEHITPLPVWSLAHMQCIVTATNQVIHNFLTIYAASAQKHVCYIITCMLTAMPFMQYTRGLQDSLLSESETESVKEKPDEEIRLIALLSLPAGL